MNCTYCGAPLTDGADTCARCGAKIPPGAASGPAPETVSRDPNGVYRWRYDLNLLKTPTIFWLVWRIFFFIWLAICAGTLISDAIRQKRLVEGALLTDIKALAVAFLVMTALVGLGYLLYAAMMGGKYCVVFEMDETGVRHTQIPAQAKKAKRLAAATTLVGLASGRLTTAGVGLNASRTEMYSEFAKVKKVKAYPRRGLIKVNGTLNRNQIYVAAADFDFVHGFIVSHCPNLKK